MSLLDRAFVKAYTRSHAPANQVAGPSDAAPVESLSVPSLESELAGRLSAVHDAVAWSDLSEASYFRVDVGHLSSPRSSLRSAAPATSAATSPATTTANSFAKEHASAANVAVSNTENMTSPSSLRSMDRTAVQHLSTGRSAHAIPVGTAIPVATAIPIATVVPKVESGPHANRSAMSHTLTAYDSAPMTSPVDGQLYHRDGSVNRVNSYEAKPAPELKEEAMQVRIDEPHIERVWTPPVIAEPQDYYRPRRNPEESAEFARAKQEALANENLRAASQSTASFASSPSPSLGKADRTNPASSIDQVAPLSTATRGTAAPATIRRKSFEPLWEVDAFDFSDTIVELFGDAKLMKSIGVPLDEAVANGLRSILITSGMRGVGRTSVAIGIAVSAAAAGLRVALVDADTQNAGLADALRLEVADGWPTAIQNGVPLDEVAIRSIEDQFTVIPTRVDSLANQTKPAEFDYLVNQLRDAFDLVIIDGAAWCDDSSVSQTQLVDAAIMVVDARHRDAAQEAVIQNALRRAGVAGLGMVENFA